MAAPTGPLISADALRAELAGPVPPVVLEVRWALGGPDSEQEYLRGHLPGAFHLDLDTVLAGPRTPGSGRHPLPDAAVLQAFLRSVGVDQDTRVVVLDANGSTSAARGWWVLRWAGLRAVTVLDGGLAAWAAAGGEVTTVVPSAREGHVVVRAGSLPVLDANAAARLARTGVLLDARAPERYRGEVEPVDPVAGHVPGALNAPTTANLAPDGRFLPPARLAERFADLGVRPGTAVGVYCGSGVTATHELLALAVAGVDATLYPGSWSEWVASGERPVATGPDPG